MVRRQRGVYRTCTSISHLLTLWRCRIDSILRTFCFAVLFCMLFGINQRYKIYEIWGEELQRPNVEYQMSRQFVKENFHTENISQFDSDETKWKNKNYSLILFTTFNLLNANVFHIYAHNIVIRNWVQFLPDVQPVLFADTYSHPLVKLAEKYNWIVFATPSVNQYGTPHLKPMYDVVFRNFNSTFYAFANGDNIFDNTLLQTLNAVKLKLSAYTNNVMIVGRRYNTEAIVDAPITKYIRRDLKPLIGNGTQGPTFAIDYFIVTRDGCSLNWTGLANVVIGRRGYDNYIVHKAKQEIKNVIDASKTIVDVHIKEPKVIFGSSNRKDHNFNMRLIGKDSFNSGRTNKVELYTDFINSTAEVAIFSRHL